ncbi:hypothetical protein RB195_013608 [Necator americanus]|uniref:Uncharacterized protein n=1 Tax=Necator americanus TaxID=51031 RepID=A0ABR1DXY3_NECAM
MHGFLTTPINTCCYTSCLDKTLEQLKRIGSKVVNVLNKTHSNLMCIHITRTDFVHEKVATDVITAINAAIKIARRKNLSQFMIFGDDQKFMKNLSKAIIDQGHWEENVKKILLGNCTRLAKTSIY